MTDLLGVELVGEDVVVHLEGEGDSVAQTEVSTEANAGNRGDHLAGPKEGEIFLRIGLRDVVRAVAEAQGGTAADEHERIEHAVMLVAEELSQVEGQVGSALEVVELVHLERSDDSALALEAGGIETHTEGRIELITEGESSSRRNQILEGRLTDGVGGTSLNLSVPVRIELHAGIRLALLRKCNLGTQRNGENQC